MAENDNSVELLEIGRKLVQEEMDRRFLAIQDLMDERRDNAQLDRIQLRAEVKQRIEDIDILNVQRHADLKELMQTISSDAKEAVQAALTSAKDAVVVAQIAEEKRLDALNEFRASLADQTSTFIPRPEMEARLSAMAQRTAELLERLNGIELRVAGRLDHLEGLAVNVDRSHDIRQDSESLRLTSVAIESSKRTAMVSQIIAASAVVITIVLALITIFTRVHG